MNRRGFLGGVGVLGAGAVLSYALQPTNDRISNLEDEVEDLDARVSALETQAAQGSSAQSGNADMKKTSDRSQGGGRAASVNGAGTMVSDKFALASGQYKVSATLDVADDFSGFIVQVYGPDGGEETLFNELIQQSGTWTGSMIYKATKDGDYYVSVSNTDAAWTLVFEPY